MGHHALGNGREQTRAEETAATKAEETAVTRALRWGLAGTFQCQQGAWVPGGIGQGAERPRGGHVELGGTLPRRWLLLRERRAM